MIFIFRACVLLFLFHALHACELIERTILEGKLTGSGKLTANNQEYSRKDFIPVNATHFEVCVCGGDKLCLPKCCPIGMAYNESLVCVNRDESPIKIPIYDKHSKNLDSSINKFQLIFNDLQSKCSGYFLSLNASYPEDVYYVLSNGHLYLPNASEGPKSHSKDAFCVENIFSETSEVLQVFLCFPAEHTFYPYGLIISIPFLIITLLVYALIPELQNINGKNLMSQLSAMIVAYTLLAILQQMENREQRAAACIVGTYVIQYAFLATFFWLNVTSYDLWFTFSGPGRLRGGHHKHKLKFYLYSAYAWGSALLITLITILIDNLPNIPNHIVKPNIDADACWLDEQALFPYFYGPISVILTTNLIFFGITAWNLFIYQCKSQKILRGSKNNTAENKQKFFLYCKLFFIMGVNWIMEVISFGLQENSHIFVISDICNSLQGVFIFFIFVFKKRTFILLKEKFGYGKNNERQTGTSSFTFSSVRTNTARESSVSHALGSKLELSKL